MSEERFKTCEHKHACRSLLLRLQPMTALAADSVPWHPLGCGYCGTWKESEYQRLTRKLG